MAVTIEDRKNQQAKKYAGSSKHLVLRSGVVDLRALAQIARIEARTVITTLLIFLATAIIYLHIADQKYAVRMVITGVNTHTQTPAGGTLEELGTLAGIDIASGNNPQFKLFVGALRSPFAAQAIAADQDLLKEMFWREWSAAEGRWRQPPNILRPVVHIVKRALGWNVPPYSPPGVGRVFDYLKDELKIVSDNKSGTVTLQIDSAKPNVAERILVTMNNALDERMRQHDLERATADIGYLSQRLAAITVEDYRRALVTNLVQQEKIRMLASAPPPYISDVLGRPMISAKPVSPVPLAVLAAALIVGGLVGLGIATIRYQRRS